MSKAVFMSINSIAVEKIAKKIKNYEFRNYLPKKDFNSIYVYTTFPKGEIKYLLKIDQIVKYPELINKKGDGNNDYNNGMKSKYAYSIKEIYELLNPIKLDELRKKYGFNPPQSYAYDERYQVLSNIIENSEKKRL